MKNHLTVFLILLLTACSENSWQTGTPPTNTSPEETLRNNFISACVEAARPVHTDSNTDILTRICTCTHDETAASFGTPEQWRLALNRYDQGQNAREIETRMAIAAKNCALKYTPTPTTPS